MKWWKDITKEDEQLDKSYISFQITSEMKKMWCPIIWTTDRQQRLLHESLRKKLFPYMTEYCVLKKTSPQINTDFIQKEFVLICEICGEVHFHCLFPYTLDTDLT